MLNISRVARHASLLDTGRHLRYLDSSHVKVSLAETNLQETTNKPSRKFVKIVCDIASNNNSETDVAVCVAMRFAFRLFYDSRISTDTVFFGSQCLI